MVELADKFDRRSVRTAECEPNGAGVAKNGDVAQSVKFIDPANLSADSLDCTSPCPAVAKRSLKLGKYLLGKVGSVGKIRKVVLA